MYYKQLFLSILILLLASGTGFGAVEGLVGHWSLDEGSGAIANDSSEYANGGVLQGTPQWVDGHIKGGLSFNGSTDYVEVPHSTAFETITNQVTICAWINVDNFINWAAIVGKGTTNSPWNMQIWGDGSLRIAINFKNPPGHVGGRQDINSFAKMATGVWIHTAVTCDGSTIRFYMNGVEDTAGAVNTEVVFGSNTEAMSIGADFPGGDEYFDGTIDDVWVFNRALSTQELANVMAGVSAGFASGPNPADAATDVSRDVILNWSPGEYATTHDVYFGKTFADINDATVATAAGLDVNSLDPRRLQFGKKYYWRVDEVNGAPDNTVFKGAVWSFAVEPYSIEIPGANTVATASSSSNEFSEPGKTLDGSGLGEDGIHAIATETMWFTATDDVAPWIQYEFDGVKKLDIMTVWNSNSSAEGFVGYGVKGVLIETSVDGQTWDVFEDVNEFSRATGLPTYNQPDEIVLGGIAVQMVRLTIQSNWGGILNSFSLSEVRFSAIPVAARTPVPVSEATGITPDAVLSWRAGREAAQSTVYVGTDPNEVAEGVAPSATSNTNSIDLGVFDLQLGTTYYWRVDEVNSAEAVSVWSGPVWSFSTVPALVVEDFESYNNDSPNRPFQTWIDGFGFTTPAPGNPGNGTGSGVGHDIWDPASEHYNGDIMETSNTMPGSGQSMPFYYTNSGGVASQTERTFATAQDWTIGGAQTLSIAFSGQIGNTGTLYAKINSTKVTYPRAATNLALGTWQAWNIDLSSMNVQAVTKLQIGVEGSGAIGMILIDDIRLHSTAGEMVYPVDPGSENLVGAWSFDEGSGTVVADSSGNGRNGTIIDATWDTGKQGSALSFDGFNAHVNIDGYQGIVGDGVETPPWSVTAWVKTFDGGEVVGWGGDGNGNRMEFRIDAGRTRAEGGGGATTGDTVMNDGDWHHIAMTVQPNSVYSTGIGLWLDGQLDTRSNSDPDPWHPTANFDMKIGVRYNGNGRLFTGEIDEVRIYDKVLSVEELLWLAGRTTPIDKSF